MRKKILSQFVVAAGSLLLLLMGVYAFADWTPPLATPPTCATGNPGCDAPIHVGLTGQVKNGGLTVGANSGVVNGLRVLFGNVGIGDTTPLALFTVGSGGLFRVDSSGRILMPAGALGAGTLALSFTGDTNTGLYSGGADILRFATAGADRVTVGASGNVGIGTTSPNAKLQVTGGDINVATQGNGLILKATNGNNCYRLTVNNSGIPNIALVACP